MTAKTAKKAQKKRSAQTQKSAASNWPVKSVNPPKLKDWEWGLMGVIGILLLTMAVLQLISFSDFRDNLSEAGLSGATAWAVCVILAELWGAVGFFKLPLSISFRYVSYGLAVLAAGFWFVQHMQLLSSGVGEQLTNSGFFGRFLAQAPGWWTALEVSILLFAVICGVGLLRDRQTVAKR